MPMSWVVTFGSAALALSFLMGHVHGRWVARRNRSLFRAVAGAAKENE